MVILSQDMIAELKDMLGDDFQFFLDTFTRDMNTRYMDIAAAVDAQDAESVRHASHSLKGSSSNVGADDLTDACSKLEALSVTGVLSGAQELVKAIDDARLALIPELEKLA